jgi:3-methyladenine DNA glycosylase/8-oxoguanine DNA glycosylase
MRRSADSRAAAVFLDCPKPFRLDLVARSHGWYDLAPFDYDREAGRLTMVFLAGDRPKTVTIFATKEGLGVSATGGVTKSALAAVRRVLDLDADLSAFHAACRSRDGFDWIARAGAGRMLKSPTLFEDAVKVLLTTNCSWGLTRAMVGNLIESFGRGGAFPNPEHVASMSEATLRKAIRVGYRAPFLAKFADAVASNRLDLSRWEEKARPDEEVAKEIHSQPGFGPYAVQTLGRLLGRHAGLGLDSWSRKKVAELRFKGRPVKDRRVESFYRPFGEFAGLAFWLDVTREWHADSEALWP